MTFLGGNRRSDRRGQVVYGGKLMQAVMTCFYFHKCFIPLAAQFYKLTHLTLFAFMSLITIWHHMLCLPLACLSWLPLYSWSLNQCLAYRYCCSVLSCVRLSASLWTAAHQAPLSSTISWSLLQFMSVESVMPSNHLILCRPLLLLPLIFPSIKVFSNKSALRIKVSKYWSFSNSPSNEDSGLISFRIY